VGRSLLDVPERHPGVQGGSDESVPQSVGADVLVDAGAPGAPVDESPGTVTVHALGVRA